MKLTILFFLALSLSNDAGWQNPGFLNTGQSQQISPDPASITGIKGRLIEFEGGGRLMMDGLYFPDSRKFGPISSARRHFFEDQLKPQDVLLDHRPFDGIGTGINRYGDRHGKLLTEERVWVQEFLVREGLALWSGSAVYPPELVLEMQRAEKEAEKRKRGLWRHIRVLDGANPVMPAPKGSFIIAEGRIREVYVSPKNTYLNFGEDWRTDFTAAIPSKSRSKFASGDWKLTALKNKMVRIRGWIRFYNGPFMELNFPQQLEVLEMTGDSGDE